MTVIFDIILLLLEQAGVFLFAKCFKTNEVLLRHKKLDYMLATGRIYEP